MFYDFPSLFEYQRLPFYFSGSPLFILESLFHPRALTTGQLPQRRWRGNMERADWPWNIYGSLVLWLYEVWQRCRITVTPPQTKGLVCCYLLWLGEVHAFPPYIQSPSFASFLSFLFACERYLYRVSILISFSMLCFFLLLFYPFHSFLQCYFLQISSQQSVLALSPPSAFSSHSISHLISSALSSLHHIHNDRLMAASAAPLSNNKVTQIGPN